MVLSCCKRVVCVAYSITSKHDGDFYCLNCFHSYSTEIKLEKYVKMDVKIMIIVMLKCMKKTTKY